MSDPGSLGQLLHGLPSDPAQLVRVVQGLLVHGDVLGLYRDPAAFTEASRTTLPVAERLARLANRGGAHLAPRPPLEREIGTCRDFALLLCAFLRSTGTPARVRCGFASYFGPGWEDHWVCERWDVGEGRWHLADAQIDPVIGEARGIVLDPADVPRETFLTASEAWKRVRSGRADPGVFGHGEEGRGLWFVGVNVVRDALALAERLTTSWDRWREAHGASRVVTLAEITWLDELVSSPEELVGEPVPPWRAARSASHTTR